MYEIEVVFSPVFEMLVSLQAFVSVSHHKSIDDGSAWARKVKPRLPETLVSRLAGAAARKMTFDGFIPPLVMACPQSGSVELFLQWLRKLAPGDIYECLSPYQAWKTWDQPLGTVRDNWASLLEAWNDAYFETVDGVILNGLADDARRIQELVPTMTPSEVVERATHGLSIDEGSGVERVILVPQYHFRPWNLNDRSGAIVINWYPVDLLPLGEDEIPPHLLRLVKALGDESRLRLLRDIGRKGMCTFTELVSSSGLSKGTVHHHLVALRAAGLVVLKSDLAASNKYELCREAIDGLSERVKGFVLS